jgi:nitroimidazol reductase NimA-like FMN-containing flavoprotein (pyridoxamine 5'-phosphate oxidase superfamily)
MLRSFRTGYIPGAMTSTSTAWPETVDRIIDGDHVVMLAYVTPASGVVLTPVTNFGVHDRETGTVTVNTSVGAWKKLDRMRRNPHVALAFHTRAHALHDRLEYVLVQGRASLSAPIPDYPASILEHWERVEPWGGIGPLWKWWLRAYALRVGIEVTSESVTAWPDLACRETPDRHGVPAPATIPEPQRPPAGGTDPRINASRAAKATARLPNVLLGWVGADGFPEVVPVTVTGAERRGLILDVPPGLVPPGGRRAGLTAHWFARGVVGQHQRVHTGWLEVDPERGDCIYAPHTQVTYRFPASTFLFRLFAGGATRWRIRGARRAGLDTG